jgi:hypothetical protein
MLKWLEQKLCTGDIIKDYGIIADDSRMGAHVKVYALLCKRGDKVNLVFRCLTTSLLSVNVSYVKLEANGEILKRLRDALDDAEATVGRRYLQ